MLTIFSCISTMIEMLLQHSQIMRQLPCSQLLLYLTRAAPSLPQCRRPLPSPKLDFVKKFTIANHVVNYFTSTKPTKKTPVKVSISVWVIVMPRYPKHKGRKEPRRIPSSVGHHSYLTFDSGYYLNHWRATTHKSTF